MDVAIIIDRLTPGAQYTGSLTEGTEAQFNNLSWTDEDPKPSWQDILDEWEIYQEEQDALKDYKIYDYVLDYFGNMKLWPVRIDFITGLTQRLHPKHTFVFGELNQTIYYADISINQNGSATYSTPVVKETFTYARDEVTGFPIYRTNNIQWYFTDGSLGLTVKTLFKYYGDDPISSLQELARRRDNNIKNTIGAIIGLVALTQPNKPRAEVLDEGRAFFFNSAYNRTLYIEDGNPALIDDVRDNTSISWFDDDIQAYTGLPTIRSFIIYQLSMGQETS